jgi:uncharacterized protein (TIGR01777 family)
VVSGASGLIGAALVKQLSSEGHRITRLVRRPAGTNELSWDPAEGRLDLSSLGTVDAIVNLSGENIATRWTEHRKQQIRETRVLATGLLSRAAARLQPHPRVLISASAMGIYGDRGDEQLTESSPIGDPTRDFLVSVCRDWEAAAEPARQAGIRVIHPRFAVVLGTAGGALARLLPIFRAGLGGRVGAGTQWMSWITLDDTAAILARALGSPGLEGPLNVSSPNPVTNAEFTRTLAHVLGRPARLPVPATALRLIYGAMAQSTLLASSRMLPARLGSLDYRFRFPDLLGALQHLLAEKN